MAQFAPLAALVVAAGTTAASLLDKPKAPTVPPPININSAEQAQNAQDSMLGRQGSAADMLTGQNGAQPMVPGPKTLLGN